MKKVVLLFLFLASSCVSNNPSVEDSEKIEEPKVLENQISIVLDKDNDGIDNDIDNCINVINVDQNDLDGDGVGDACDHDIDDDGIVNTSDNCRKQANPNQENLDGDSFGDLCDEDIDNDLVGNSTDNCQFVVNRDQSNLDGDSFGDACDDDLDGDSIVNASDNCPNKSNRNQNDFDGNGVGDACEDDIDSDNVADATDNCLNKHNPNQSDIDGDSIGDVCDEDIDDDQIANNLDNCPNVSNINQYDLDNDGEGNACDTTNSQEKIIIESLELAGGENINLPFSSDKSSFLISKQNENSYKMSTSGNFVVANYAKSIVYYDLKNDNYKEVGIDPTERFADPHDFPFYNIEHVSLKPGTIHVNNVAKNVFIPKRVAVNRVAKKVKAFDLFETLDTGYSFTPYINLNGSLVVKDGCSYIYENEEIDTQNDSCSGVFDSSKFYFLSKEQNNRENVTKYYHFRNSADRVRINFHADHNEREFYNFFFPYKNFSGTAIMIRDDIDTPFKPRNISGNYNEIISFNQDSQVSPLRYVTKKVLSNANTYPAIFPNVNDVKYVDSYSCYPNICLIYSYFNLSLNKDEFWHASLNANLDVIKKNRIFVTEHKIKEASVRAIFDQSNTKYILLVRYNTPIVGRKDTALFKDEKVRVSYYELYPDTSKIKDISLKNFRPVGVSNYINKGSNKFFACYNTKNHNYSFEYRLYAGVNEIDKRTTTTAQSVCKDFELPGNISGGLTLYMKVKDLQTGREYRSSSFEAEFP